MEFNLIFSVTILILTFIFIIWDIVPRVVSTLLGASLLVVFHVVTQEQAFASVDFNVISLLVGMMILVNILGHTGALDCVATWAAKTTRGHAPKLLIAFSSLAAVLSAFLDNVTTIILLGNITCAIARKLRLNPVPFLICEAIASNVGGTATLIGDPPNIMIGSAAGLDFNSFLLTLTPFILLIFPVVLGTLYLIYREELKTSTEITSEILNVSAADAITDRPLMYKALFVISLVFVGFMLHGPLHLEAGTIALAGAAILMIFENRKSIWSDVEWTSIFFFIGLFVVVGAVEKTGGLDFVSQSILEAVQGHSPIVVSIAVLWISAFCSAIVDNIPYTATMIPIIKTLESHCPGNILWWALSLGACLGGNASLIGATANVVAADIALANGVRLGFLQFTLVGIIVTIETLALSSIYLYFLTSRAG